MKKNSLFLGVMALTGLFASCSQTETDDLAGKTIEKGKQVSVTLAAPADFMQPGTRATEELKMRYIVEVWDSTADSLLQRKESLEGNTGDANKFTFDLDNGTYQLLCWADRVAAGTVATSATMKDVTFDHYKDNCFNTIWCISSSTNDYGLQAVVVSPGTGKRYNNAEVDNAFCGKLEVKKDENIIENLDITLKRPVCRITYRQRNASAANTTDICKSAKIGRPASGESKYVIIRDDYNVFTQTPGSLFCLNGSAEIPLLADAASTGDLFFYHTFAGETLSAMNPENENNWGDAYFSFEKADGAQKELQDLKIPKGTILIQANRKVILTGNILQFSTLGTSSNFTLTTDDNWSEEGDSTQDLDQ